ncbi:TerD family protein [Clostridium sp. D53t1_180928_C8]|uniref:TerD family protein n=1 Tax=Clostridium sp. D53t1_180928_C8 TaxID=2787101 RepID=UPI0018AA235E|nr:TerD family protein [Clostridium sp. D53t1_180928_C8]
MLNLTKGALLDLSKKDPDLRLLQVGLGWDTRMDLDSHAYLLDNNNKLVEHVSFSNLKGAGVRLNGDNMTGKGDGDDEIVFVNFSELKDNVSRISFYVNIFSFNPFSKKDFSQVKGAYVRLINSETNKELCKYNITDSGKGVRVFHFADLVRVNGTWSFEAIGNPCEGKLLQIEQSFNK